MTMTHGLSTSKRVAEALIIIFTLLLLLGSVAMVSIGVSGQELPDDPRNRTTTEQTIDGQRIDSNVVLTDWDFDRESQTFTLHFQSEERTSITITEAVSSTGGSGRMSIERVRLSKGEQKVQFRVSSREDAALAITTRQSIQQGHGTFVAAGADSLPLPRVNLAFGVAVGISVMVVGMAVAVYRKRTVDHKEVESGWS